MHFTSQIQRDYSRVSGVNRFKMEAINKFLLAIKFKLFDIMRSIKRYCIHFFIPNIMRPYQMRPVKYKDSEWAD